MKTLNIPKYTATDERVNEIKKESLAKFSIPYLEAEAMCSNP
jgi:hypothetical protein